MSFLPDDFVIPVSLETDRFRICPLSVNHIVMDYDAVMSSRDRLWRRFGESWGWPRADMTLEQDLVDLGWHQKEFQIRSSFAYAVLNLEETRLLGCVYVDPPQIPGCDAEVCFWVRESEADTGLEENLQAVVTEWIAREWPFARVAYPGRTVG